MSRRAGGPARSWSICRRTCCSRWGHYTPPEQARHKTYRPQTTPDPARVAEAVELIAAAKKPLFYGGGGLINSGPEACARFTEFVRLVDAPCTLTLMGLGALPASDPHFLGMVGMHGLYEANMAMHDCDVMIAVGSRFDDRVTGRLNAFAPNSKKIHIDIDPSSINKNVRVDVPMLGDCGETLRALLAGVAQDGARIPTARPATHGGGRSIPGGRATACATTARARTSSSRNTRWSGSTR